MQKTANYQLNQWEENDRILRTEFNEDNARVDAAIQAAESAHLVRLRHVDLPKGTTNNGIEFDMTGIDPKDWMLLVVDASIKSNFYPHLLINDMAIQRQTMQYYSDGSMQFVKNGYPVFENDGSTLVVIPVCYGAMGTIPVVGLSRFYNLGEIRLNTGKLNKFSVNYGNSQLNFGEDSHITIWGVR